MILKTTEVLDYKRELFKNQNGRCALTGLPIKDISKAHLDHDHILDGDHAGRCRGLLVGNANVLEGRLKHQFKRSGLASDIDYIDFLKNLVHYLEQSYADRPRHPQLIPDQIKRFKKLNHTQMSKKLLEVGLDNSGSKNDLIIRYRKYLRVKYAGENQTNRH